MCWRQFLSCGLLFPDIPVCVQVDKNKPTPLSLGKILWQGQTASRFFNKNHKEWPLSYLLLESLLPPETSWAGPMTLRTSVSQAPPRMDFQTLLPVLTTAVWALGCSTFRFLAAASFLVPTSALVTLVAMLEHHGQSDWWKKEFIWVYDLRETRVRHGGAAWQKVVGTHRLQDLQAKRHQQTRSREPEVVQAVSSEACP